MTADLITLPRPNCKDLERFFSKIRLSETRFYKGSPCWEWTAALTKSGYARFKFKGKTRRAHRVAYAWFVGPIPPPEADENIDHKCNNSACVNTSHLEIENAVVNVLRADGPCAKNARKTTCIDGHPLAGDNLFIDSQGYRQCRSCVQRRSKEERRRHPEKSAQQWQKYYSQNKQRLNEASARRKAAKRKRLRELKATDH